MHKILGELILKLLMANGLENSNGNALWRNILVVFILVFALGLLQYSEVMLNVSQIRAQHEIERPVELLEYKLQSCKDLLENTEQDLHYCRTNTSSRAVQLPDPVPKTAAK